MVRGSTLRIGLRLSVVTEEVASIAPTEQIVENAVEVAACIIQYLA